MERLTHPKRDERGNVQCAKQYTCDHEEPCDECEQWPLIAEKVYKYEDTGLSPEEVAELARAKDEGRLMVLPVPLGEQLFQPYDGEIITWDLGYIVRDFYDDITLGCLQADDHDLSEEFLMDVIGTKLFLTREAAEAALQRSAT